MENRVSPRSLRWRGFGESTDAAPVRLYGPNAPFRQGLGETRFPHPLTGVGGGWRPGRQGCGSTGSPQVGKPGFPIFTSGPMRGAHNARMNIVLFLGGLRPPKPSRGRAMFTSVIHAAAPHNARMNIVLFLGGLRPPKPSPLAGYFLGGLRPPKPSRGRAMFTSVIHAAAPHDARMNIVLFLGGRSPPKPSPLAGYFLEGLRPPKPSRGRAMFTSVRLATRSGGRPSRPVARERF